MKTILVFLVIINTVVVAQNKTHELRPTSIIPLDLSEAQATIFNNNITLFYAAAKKLENGATQESLTEREQKILNETDETNTDYWATIGNGCSWYCAGGPDSIIASSALKPQGANKYEASNAHDFSYKDAWVEGVPGYGVGEFLKYWFSPDGPVPAEIIVVNGYVKSERSYLDNSRVKKLKVYVNDQPQAVLLLEDRRSKQVFQFKPDDAIGNQPRWTLKLEILEVYKGLKYDDVVISEIFFDGPSH